MLPDFEIACKEAEQAIAENTLRAYGRFFVNEFSGDLGRTATNVLDWGSVAGRYDTAVNIFNAVVDNVGCAYEHIYTMDELDGFADNLGLSATDVARMTNKDFDAEDPYFVVTCGGAHLESYTVFTVRRVLAELGGIILDTIPELRQGEIRSEVVIEALEKVTPAEVRKALDEFAPKLP